MARGITLIELLATLAVASVALALALPGFHELQANTRSAAALNQFVGAINVARTEAIVRGRTVTLCPASGTTCLGRNRWHRGALIFLDANGNGTVDASEQILNAVPALEPGERVYWRSFRNRSYLQFHPRGYTQWQNGNFLYCPPDGAARHARMAIINAQGRVRLARDGDGDGIAEDARGRPLECP